MTSRYLEQTYGLTGRTALVTGARTGIGRACALALDGAGDAVIPWGRTPESLDEAAGEVAAQGVKARVIGADMSDAEAVESLASELASSTPIDVLVNNAGMIARGPSAGVTIDSWREVLTVNLDAVFLLSRIFGTPMTERGRGAIINIASVLSFQGGLNVAAYTASKHAVAGLTKSLANEWAALGVNVNAVAPGYVVTESTRPLREDTEREASIRSRIPAGHWAEPNDVAAAVAFLATPAARYVHGHTLVVDGGWLGR
ncbi:2-dehydro-3-deoxy-D-gluconate 5-dehydrogenase KduD [soil metagenome]